MRIEGLGVWIELGLRIGMGHWNVGIGLALGQCGVEQRTMIISQLLSGEMQSLEPRVYYHYREAGH